MEELNRINKIRKILITIVSVLFSLYALYGVIVTINPIEQRNIHLTFALLLAFLIHPLFKKASKIPKSIAIFIDFLALILILFQGIYMYLQAPDLALRQGVIYSTDYVAFIIVLLLLLEAGRRLLGGAITILMIISIAYMWLGPFLPGFLNHNGISFSRMTAHMYTNEISGIYGSILGLSATLISIFVIFGAVLVASGVGKFFIDISYSLFGSTRGGPAKISVFVSSLFGMVNGSAAANVVTTGSFTIPTMKKIGYKSNFAGAVEAVASSGGQIMPPIMGIGAFLMADLIGIPYTDVIIAAFIPAILYFISVYFGVDIEARKLNLRGLSKEELPNIKNVIKKNWIYLVPLGTLLYLLIFSQYSVSSIGFWVIMLAIIVSWMKKESRMGITQIIKALAEGGKNATMIAVLCALAGIIIGILGITGLALKLATGLVVLSGGSLILLLIFTMIASIVLGMGLPTGTAYIMVAILVAPAIVNFGIEPLAAHLFVFYFAVISAITPPVAIAAFSAAAISHGNPNKTGFLAMRLATAAFIVPFVFVYDTKLLMIDAGYLDIFISFITALIGAFLLAVGVNRYYFSKLTYIQSIIMIVSALFLIIPGIFTDVFGILPAIIILYYNFISNKKESLKNVEQSV